MNRILFHCWPKNLFHNKLLTSVFFQIDMAASAKRHPPLRPSSTTNRAVRAPESRAHPSARSADVNDLDEGIANGKQVPRSYLLKLIKGSKSNGILNLASRGLTEGETSCDRAIRQRAPCDILVPREIFLDDIVDDENQQRLKLKTPDFNQNANEAWWQREPLKTLDLSSNLLTALPDDIENLDYLVVLNVIRHISSFACISSRI